MGEAVGEGILVEVEEKEEEEVADIDKDVEEVADNDEEVDVVGEAVELPEDEKVMEIEGRLEREVAGVEVEVEVEVELEVEVALAVEVEGVAVEVVETNGAVEDVEEGVGEATKMKGLPGTSTELTKILTKQSLTTRVKEIENVPSPL